MPALRDEPWTIEEVERLVDEREGFYQSHGVPGYWVVDGNAECFEVWRPGETRPLVLDERLTWLPEGAAEPFELDVREFFASIADEG